ncbi:MAG: hypothetical protein ACYDD9_02225 [Acidithiobacillus sp.]
MGFQILADGLTGAELGSLARGFGRRPRRTLDAGLNVDTEFFRAADSLKGQRIQAGEKIRRCICAGSRCLLRLGYGEIIHIQRKGVRAGRVCHIRTNHIILCYLNKF